eukprot:2740567-Prymnesium_polylepis.1
MRLIPHTHGALLPEQGVAGALTLPGSAGTGCLICVYSTAPCLLRVPDACPVRVPRPVDP